VPISSQNAPTRVATASPSSQITSLTCLNCGSSCDSHLRSLDGTKSRKLGSLGSLGSLGWLAHGPGHGNARRAKGALEMVVAMVGRTRALNGPAERSLSKRTSGVDPRGSPVRQFNDGKKSRSSYRFPDLCSPPKPSAVLQFCGSAGLHQKDETFMWQSHS
jgi:hypothetical protein